MNTPKLDLTPYRGAWDMTPADILATEEVMVKQAQEYKKRTEYAGKLHAEGRTADAMMILSQVMQFTHHATVVYIDCLFSRLRNRVRSGR